MVRRWLLVCFLTGVLVGVLGSVTYWRTVLVDGEQETCLRGIATLETSPWGYKTMIGSQLLCGKHLRWGPVSGPVTSHDLEGLTGGR